MYAGTSEFNTSYTMRLNNMKQYRQKHFVSRQDGFTLIEVMIVIAIFSIGILGAMAMQTSAVTTNAISNESTLAMEYATDTMERLMQIGANREDRFNFDDNGVGGIDEIAESELQNDGIDNDGDGATDEADELEWFRLPEFAVGTDRTRGVNIPTNAYYNSIFDLTWDVADIDCDGDGTMDARRVDMTATWNNGQKNIQLTNIRTNIL